MDSEGEIAGSALGRQVGRRANSAAPPAQPTESDHAPVGSSEAIGSANASAAIAAYATAVDGRAQLGAWRQAIQPPTSSWWGALDLHAAAQETRHHPLWDLFAGSFMLTISLSLTAEIARRFLAEGANFLGIFSALSSLLLSVLGGSAFTTTGT